MWNINWTRYDAAGKRVVVVVQRWFHKVRFINNILFSIFNFIEDKTLMWFIRQFTFTTFTLFLCFSSKHKVTSHGRYRTPQLSVSSIAQQSAVCCHFVIQYKVCEMSPHTHNQNLPQQYVAFAEVS